MEKNPNRHFVIFHVPHDGEAFPPELMDSVCISRKRFMAYHEKMRDVGCQEMVPVPWRDVEHVVYFPISRLLCDVERFLGDSELMEQYGMGFCYERAYDGTQIKVVTEGLKEKTLCYYREHHVRLDRLCAEHPKLLLLDLHSFSDELVPREQLRRDEETPDVCLGIDESYTPEDLVSVAERCLHNAGFSTTRNYPYSGSLVPNTVLTKSIHCDCASIMLEWNKRAYCKKDELPDAETLARIREVVLRIANQYAVVSALD